MADTSIQITQGAGTNIEVVSPGNGSTYRQVVAIGDPNATITAAIAAVTNGQVSVGATLYGGVNASLVGTPTFLPAAGATTTVYQGTSPWLTNASIVGTPGVNASIQGTPNVTANLAASSTLTAYQGGSPWLTNASIIGVASVNASIQGTVPVSGVAGVSLTAFQGGGWSVNLTGANNTLTAFQGGSPWLVNSSIVGTPGFLPAAGATETVYQGSAPWTANVSVQGTVPISGSFNLAAGSTVTANQGGAPWAVNASIQGVPGVNASIQGTANVALGTNATITAFQGGVPWTANVSVQGTVAVSGSFSSAPTITALQGNAPWTVNASIQGVPAVSQSGAWNVTASLANNATVTAFQGGAPWLSNVSVIGTVPVSGFPTSVNVSLLAPATVTLPGVSAVYASLAPNATLTNFNIHTQQANASVQWTSSTGVNATLGLNTTGYGTLLVTFTGVSISAGTVNFEAFDGAQWWPLSMSRNNSYGVDTSFALTPQAGNSQTWQADIAGWQQTRLRLNPVITGASGNAYFQMIANSAPNVVQMITGATLLGNVTLGPVNVSIAGNVTMGPINVSLAGVTSVNVSLLAPATVTLSGGIGVTLTGAVSLAGTPNFNMSPQASGGWSTFAASGLASLVTLSAAAGKFGGYMVMNTASTPVYLQVLDLTGNATLGLNPKMVLPIPANSTAANGLAANLEIANGIAIANGIKVGVTTGAANSTVVATGLAGTLWFK